MAKKEQTFKGKTIEELKNLSLHDFMRLVPSRQRRSLKRGFTEAQKKLLKRIRAKKPNIETHCHDLIILPEVVGAMIKVHNGREFIPVAVTMDMVGHYLGEFVLTRKKVEHSAPGVGATKSSAALSVK